MKTLNNIRSELRGRKSKILKCVLISLTIVFLSINFLGCNVTKDKAEAEKVMADYYTQIKEKNYSNVPQMCSEKFFEKTSRVEFMDMLKSINKKLGDLNSYNLKSWKINTHIGTKDSGTYYYLTYEVEYSKYTAEEEFTLFQEKDSNDILIMSYNVKSNGLFKE